MKIKKESILSAFRIFSNIYADFNKRIENGNKMEEMLNTWQEIFETIDFDYEYANDDFIEAVKRVIAKNKYVPTIAEISDEIQQMYINREEKEENKYKEIDISNITQEEYIQIMKNRGKRYE